MKLAHPFFSEMPIDPGRQIASKPFGRPFLPAKIDGF